MEKLYTCSQVAERCGLKVKTIYGWIQSGKLKAMTLGKNRWIRESDIIEFETKCMKHD